MERIRNAIKRDRIKCGSVDEEKSHCQKAKETKCGVKQYPVSTQSHESTGVAEDAESI